jgi:hypothetical protein
MGADGISAFNFEYYRNFADVACARDLEVGVREPPFGTLKRLTDEAWVGAQNQHYFVGAHSHDKGFGSSCTGPTPGTGIEMCVNQNHTVNLTLTKPTRGWTTDGVGRLRLLVSVNCAPPSCGDPEKPASCKHCLSEPFTDTPTAFSLVALNGATLRRTTNVSNLWPSGQLNDPFDSQYYAAFDVPVAVLHDGANLVEIGVDAQMKGKKACIACGSAQPKIMHLDLQLPSSGYYN